VTTLGIDPETLRLAGQHLNHYAIYPRPLYVTVYNNNNNNNNNVKTNMVPVIIEATGTIRNHPENT
jgi:hypothetical protein